MVSELNIIGTAKILANLIKAQEKVTNKIDQNIHKAGLFLEGKIKDSIVGKEAEHKSVDTGRFLGSITTNNSKPFISVVFTNVEYAKYLEFGTSKIAPRSHFGNSASRNIEDIRKIIIEGAKI